MSSKEEGRERKIEWSAFDDGNSVMPKLSLA